MIKALTALLFTLTVATAGCVTPPSGETYETLRRRTEREIQLAAASGFIWDSTEATLAEAKAAHQTGDLEKATRLAQTALTEAIQAQAQARAATKTKADFSYRP